EKPSSSRRALGGGGQSYNGAPGKSTEDETAAARLGVAGKRGNARGAKGALLHRMSSTRGGRGEMTKAPITLQDLRRRLYVKATADPSWDFWACFAPVSKARPLRQ